MGVVRVLLAGVPLVVYAPGALLVVGATIAARWQGR